MDIITIIIIVAFIGLIKLTIFDEARKDENDFYS